MRSHAPLALLLVSLVAACGRSSAAAEGTPSVDASASASALRTASCDRIATMGVCSEYGATQLAEGESVLTFNCTKLKGAFVSAECPNTAILGSCKLSTGETRKLYASGAVPYDAARAEKECESLYRGAWAPFR